MKKKISFAIVALVSCLAILFGVIMKFPHSAHAMVDTPLRHTSTPTIKVSPTALNLSQCSSVNINNYVVCTVTLTINQPVKKGLNWTSSYSATLCFYNSCRADYHVAVLPSQGSLNAANPSVQVSIIVSDYCRHGYENATIVFAVPGSQANVKYFCTSADG